VVFIKQESIIGERSKFDRLVLPGAMSDERDYEQGRIVHIDPELFNRRNKVMLAVGVATENARKEFYQPLSSDWRPHVVPGSVASNSNIDIATNLWVPLVDGRVGLIADLFGQYA